MAARFSTLIASDPDHEKVYAEIYFGEKFVALISQEAGPESLMLELPGCELDQEQIIRNVNLEGFIVALRSAADRLLGRADP